MILFIQVVKGRTPIQRSGLSIFFIYKALEAKRLPENSARNNDIKPQLWISFDFSSLYGTNLVTNFETSLLDEPFKIVESNNYVIFSSKFDGKNLEWSQF
jgi:hypothetical protein